MRPAALCAIALAGCSGAACFSPADATPGWKRVELPADAPWLAAPGSVEQFRSDTPALVWDADLVDARMIRREPGTASLWLDAAGVSAVELELAESIDGAEVEIDGDRPFTDPLPLLRRRVTGTSLRADWDDPAVSLLHVTVHHHLRPQPVIRHARTGRFEDVTARPSTPPAFRDRGSLYYLQPASGPVLLCNAPARKLAVRAASLEGQPRVTAVRRRPLAWAQSFGWRMR